jgi:hypothetical protein
MKARGLFSPFIVLIFFADAFGVDGSALDGAAEDLSAFKKGNEMRLSRLLNIVGILPLFVASANAQVMVTTPADAGAGSLREAIGTAAVGDKILFAAPMTINLTSPIVVGVDNLIIEACYPSVALNASGLFPGLEFSGVTGCEVRGLRMEGFSPALGFRNGASGNKVGGTSPCHRMELHNGGLGIALSDSGTTLNEFVNIEVRHNLYEGIYLRNGASLGRGVFTRQRSQRRVA